MLEGAAAAELALGTGPVHPVGGDLQNPADSPGGPGFGGLCDLDFTDLPGDGIGDEDGAALHMGNSLALDGVICDGGGVNPVLNEHRAS